MENNNIEINEHFEILDIVHPSPNIDVDFVGFTLRSHQTRKEIFASMNLYEFLQHFDVDALYDIENYLRQKLDKKI